MPDNGFILFNGDGKLWFVEEGVLYEMPRTPLIGAWDGYVREVGEPKADEPSIITRERVRGPQENQR